MSGFNCRTLFRATLQVLLTFSSLSLTSCMLSSSGGSHYTVTVDGESYSVPSRRLRLSKRSRLEGDGIRIYHPRQLEAVAHELMNEMIEYRAYLQKRLGLRPADFGVCLYQYQEIHVTLGNREVTVPKMVPYVRNPSGWFLFCVGCNAEKWETGYDSFARALMHEWVEVTLISRSSIGVPSRWYTDGLAEYFSSSYCFSYNKKACARRLSVRIDEIASAEKEGHEEFDFTLWPHDLVTYSIPNGRRSSQEGKEEIYTSSLGYGLSLAFWTKFCETYGDEALTRVVTGLKGREVTDVVLIHEIERVTGKNLSREISHISLEQARNVLEKRKALIESE